MNNVNKRTKALAGMAALTGMAALAIAVPACNRSKGAGKTDDSSATSAQGGGAVAVTSADLKQARLLFKSTCSTCHGVDGRGDGPGAAALTPKPRNFTDTAWQKKVTDAHIKQTFLYGGAAVGLSPMMPSHPELEGKAKLDAALVQVVRSFGGQQ